MDIDDPLPLDLPNTGGSSKKRRSSILKPPIQRPVLQDLNVNTRPVANSSHPPVVTKPMEKRKSRRVSFSRTQQVKEFQTGKDNLTVWHPDYLENLSNNSTNISSNVSSNVTTGPHTNISSNARTGSHINMSTHVTTGPHTIMPTNVTEGATRQICGLIGQLATVSPSKSKPLNINIQLASDSPNKFLPSHRVETTDFLQSLGVVPAVDSSNFLKSITGGDSRVRPRSDSEESSELESSFVQMLNKMSESKDLGSQTKVGGDIDMSCTMLDKSVFLDDNMDNYDDEEVDAQSFLAGLGSDTSNETCTAQMGMDLTNVGNLTDVVKGQLKTFLEGGEDKTVSAVKMDMTIMGSSQGTSGDAIRDNQSVNSVILDGRERSIIKDKIDKTVIGGSMEMTVLGSRGDETVMDTTVMVDEIVENGSGKTIPLGDGTDRTVLGGGMEETVIGDGKDRTTDGCDTDMSSPDSWEEPTTDSVFSYSTEKISKVFHPAADQLPDSQPNSNNSSFDCGGATATVKFSHLALANNTLLLPRKESEEEEDEMTMAPVQFFQYDPAKPVTDHLDKSSVEITTPVNEFVNNMIVVLEKKAEDIAVIDSTKTRETGLDITTTDEANMDITTASVGVESIAGYSISREELNRAVGIEITDVRTDPNIYSNSIKNGEDCFTRVETDKNLINMNCNELNKNKGEYEKNTMENINMDLTRAAPENNTIDNNMNKAKAAPNKTTIENMNMSREVPGTSTMEDINMDLTNAVHSKTTTEDINMDLTRAAPIKTSMEDINMDLTRAAPIETIMEDINMDLTRGAPNKTTMEDINMDLTRAAPIKTIMEDIKMDLTRGVPSKITMEEMNMDLTKAEFSKTTMGDLNMDMTKATSSTDFNYKDVPDISISSEIDIEQNKESFDKTSVVCINMNITKAASYETTTYNDQVARDVTGHKNTLKTYLSSTHESLENMDLTSATSDNKINPPLIQTEDCTKLSPNNFVGLQKDNFESPSKKVHTFNELPSNKSTTDEINSDESAWETLHDTLTPQDNILVKSPLISPPVSKPRKSTGDLLRERFPSPVSEDPSPTCMIGQVPRFNSSVWEGDVTTFSPGDFESTRAINFPIQLDEGDLTSFQPYGESTRRMPVFPQTNNLAPNLSEVMEVSCDLSEVETQEEKEEVRCDKEEASCDLTAVDTREIQKEVSCDLTVMATQNNQQEVSCDLTAVGTQESRKEVSCDLAAVEIPESHKEVCCGLTAAETHEKQREVSCDLTTRRAQEDNMEVCHAFPSKRTQENQKDVSFDLTLTPVGTQGAQKMTLLEDMEITRAPGECPCHKMEGVGQGGTGNCQHNVELSFNIDKSPATKRCAEVEENNSNTFIEVDGRSKEQTLNSAGEDFSPSKRLRLEEPPSSLEEVVDKSISSVATLSMISICKQDVIKEQSHILTNAGYIENIERKVRQEDQEISRFDDEFLNLSTGNPKQVFNDETKTKQEVSNVAITVEHDSAEYIDKNEDNPKYLSPLQHQMMEDSPKFIKTVIVPSSETNSGWSHQYNDGELSPKSSNNFPLTKEDIHSVSINTLVPSPSSQEEVHIPASSSQFNSLADQVHAQKPAIPSSNTNSLSYMKTLNNDGLESEDIGFCAVTSYQVNGRLSHDPSDQVNVPSSQSILEDIHCPVSPDKVDESATSYDNVYPTVPSGKKEASLSQYISDEYSLTSSHMDVPVITSHHQNSQENLLSVDVTLSTALSKSDYRILNSVPLTPVEMSTCEDSYSLRTITSPVNVVVPIATMHYETEEPIFQTIPIDNENLSKSSHNSIEHNTNSQAEDNVGTSVVLEDRITIVNKDNVVPSEKDNTNSQAEDKLGTSVVLEDCITIVNKDNVVPSEKENTKSYPEHEFEKISVFDDIYSRQQTTDPKSRWRLIRHTEKCARISWMEDTLLLTIRLEDKLAAKRSRKSMMSPRVVQHFVISSMEFVSVHIMKTPEEDQDEEDRMISAAHHSVIRKFSQSLMKKECPNTYSLSALLKNITTYVVPAVSFLFSLKYCKLNTFPFSVNDNLVTLGFYSTVLTEAFDVTVDFSSGFAAAPSTFEIIYVVGDVNRDAIEKVASGVGAGPDYVRQLSDKLWYHLKMIEKSVLNSIIEN